MTNQANSTNRATDKATEVELSPEFHQRVDEALTERRREAIEKFVGLHAEYLEALANHHNAAGDDDVSDAAEFREVALEALMKTSAPSFVFFWTKWRLFKEELDSEEEVGQRCDKRWIRFYAYLETDLRNLGGSL